MIHGGDIYRNAVSLDFSVNVNPLGIPVHAKQALMDAVGSCSQYPDPEMQRLRQAVSRMTGARETQILLGNGASELFMAVVHALRPGKVVIPVPSFYGYEYAAGAVTEQVLYYPMKQEHGFLPDEEFLSVLDEETDLLFLANPNNPTGKQIPPELLERILEHCHQKQIRVVLDECFIEFCEKEASMIARIDQWDHLILVRAFTKIFAIPGVRLGYLVCADGKLLQKIGRQLPEWNVSSFAQNAGLACTEEMEFLQETVRYVREERAFLEAELQNMGLTVWSGAANFLMIHTEAELYKLLLKQRILVRDCSNFRGLSKGYYRLAVRTREENERLLGVLKTVL